MKGLVTEIKGKNAVVKFRRKEACGQCRACLSGMTEKDMDVEAKNLCDAELGDWVELELQENAFFNAIMVMYGLPFLGFLSGILLGYFAVPKVLPGVNEAFASIALGALGIFIAYLWIKSQQERWESGKYRPMAVRIVEEDEEEVCNSNYVNE